MTALREFNPKLASYVQENPAALNDLRKMIEEHDAAAEAAAAAEAVAAAADQYAYKPSRVYTLPWIWAWGEPIFKVTAAALISA